MFLSNRQVPIWLARLRGLLLSVQQGRHQCQNMGGRQGQLCSAECQPRHVKNVRLPVSCFFSSHSNASASAALLAVMMIKLSTCSQDQANFLAAAMHGLYSWTGRDNWWLGVESEYSASEFQRKLGQNLRNTLTKSYIFVTKSYIFRHQIIHFRHQILHFRHQILRFYRQRCQLYLRG